MKKRVIFPIVLIALLGVGFFLYPIVAEYFSNKNASTAVSDYSAAVQELDPEQKQRELARAHEYNDQLVGAEIHDPFIPGSGVVVMNDEYLSLLSINGSMGHIEIPKIDVNLPFFHGTSEETLQTGIGHLEGTSLPVGGRSTHTVLTGHSGLTTARLFTDVVNLREGDTFFIHVLGETFAYRVDQIKKVLPYRKLPLDLIG